MIGLGKGLRVPHCILPSNALGLKKVYSKNPRGPQLTYFNDRDGGWVWQRSICLYPKKIPTSEFVYPKKSLLFFSIPKKIPLVSAFNPSVLFWDPKKIQASFIHVSRPEKKSLLAQHFRPKKITWTFPWGKNHIIMRFEILHCSFFNLCCIWKFNIIDFHGRHLKCQFWTLSFVPTWKSRNSSLMHTFRYNNLVNIAILVFYGKIFCFSYQYFLSISFLTVYV